MIASCGDTDRMRVLLTGPMLVILSARACGYSGEKDALLAAVVEFIHTATLLHDDVVDDSDMRRGQETASHIWGNEAAVLVGDYLYSRAFQMMVRAQSMKIMDLQPSKNTFSFRFFFKVKFGKTCSVHDYVLLIALKNPSQVRLALPPLLSHVPRHGVKHCIVGTASICMQMASARTTASRLATSRISVCPTTKSTCGAVLSR